MLAVLRIKSGITPLPPRTRYPAAANLTGAGLPPARQRDLARPRPYFILRTFLVLPTGPRLPTRRPRVTNQAYCPQNPGISLRTTKQPAKQSHILLLFALLNVMRRPRGEPQSEAAGLTRSRSQFDCPHISCVSPHSILPPSPAQLLFERSPDRSIDEGG